MRDGAFRHGRISRFRTRLAAAAALLALVVLATANLLVYLYVQRVLKANLDRMLLSIARTEIASALDGPGGTIHIHEDGTANLALAVGAGYEKIALIKDSRGRIVAQTANMTSGAALTRDAAEEERARSGRIAFVDLRRGAEAYRAVYYPLYGPDNRRLLAIIGVSLRPMGHSLLVLALGLALSLLLGGVGAAWGAARLSRRLTRPLEEIAAAARSVGVADLSVRIPDVSSDRELAAVTSVLNEMLARLEATLLAQRRFIADASHELRSPLANLRGNVEVTLRRPRSAEEYRETLALAMGEIERLSHLTEDLLTLSRADAGQFAVRSVPCDLTEIAGQAVAAHRGIACQANIGLELDAPSAVTVNGDRDRLRQIVDNLLDNALRYAPAGSAVLIQVCREGDEARLLVRDAGAGVWAEDRKRIFDRFYRADPARARRSGGSGLGLAIVKSIIEAHQGQVCVESRPGEGATFYVVLPAANAADRQDEAG